MKTSTAAPSPELDSAFVNYQQLKQAWMTQSPNWWRWGAYLNPMIDYLSITNTTDHDIAPQALKIFGNSNQGWWFDDFGWWGIAFLNAAENASLLSADPANDQTAYLNAAQLAWERMYYNALSSWDKCDQVAYAEVAPRYSGGCWNCNIGQNVYNGSNPPGGGDGSSSLAGRQNAVVNGLFLVLTTRLLQAANNPNYNFTRQNEIQQYGPGILASHFSFLNSWFYIQGQPDQQLLNYVAFNNCVVRERVSTFSNGKSDTFFCPDISWAGDNGLMMSGLLGYDQINGTNHSTLIQQILSGVNSWMTINNVLQNWGDVKKTYSYFPPSSRNGDFQDYQTGIGVFMTHLVYVYRKMPAMQNFIKQNLRTMITSTAAYVEKPYSDFPPPNMISVGNDQIMCYANMQGALNAALVIA